MIKKLRKLRRKVLLVTLLILFVLFSVQVWNYFAPKSASADTLVSFDEGYGTTVKDSDNTVSGTITGATWKTKDLCKDDKCLYFDGSDWISFGDEASYDFASSTDFTIQLWFRHGPASSAEVLVQKYEGTGGDGGYRIQMESDGDISFGVDDANGGFADDTVSSTTADYDDNRWHHVSAVKDDTTGIYLYIDGVLIASDTSIASTGTLANNDTFYIGDSNGSDGGDEFIGFIDEVKVYTSTARTEAEISADYLSSTPDRGTSASFGPDDSFLSDGLVGYWPMDDNVSGNGQAIIDKSGNGNNGTTNYGANTTGMDCTVAGKFGSACDVDGTDDYIALGNIDEFKIEDKTISFWAKPEASITSTQSIFSSSTANWYAGFANSDRMFVSYADGTDSQQTAGGVVSAVTTSEWHHYTYTFSVSGNSVTIKYFIDGIYQEQDELTTGYSSMYGTSFVMGAFASSSLFYNGMFDEVRLYNRALTPAEVQALYHWAPGPALYYSFDEGEGTGSNAVKDKSGNNYQATLEASMTNANWVKGKFGGGLDFDGINDYLAQGSFYQNGRSGGMTVSLWVKPDTNLTSGSARQQFSSHYFGTHQFQYENGDIDIELYDATSNYTGYSYSTSLNKDTWYHLTFTAQVGGKVYLYIDGIQHELGSAPSSLEDVTANLTIARVQNNSFYLNGTVDEFKIYNYARTPSQIIEDMNGGHPVGGSPISSMRHYWSFDENYGTTAYDTGFDTVNGTLDATNTPSWAEGKISNAIDCEADESDHVDIGSIVTPGDTQMTFTAWIKPESFGGWPAGQGSAFRFQLTDADTVVFWINGNDVSDVDTSDSDTINMNTTIPTDGWTHFAAIWDGETGQKYLYLNGKLEGSATTTVTDFNASSGNGTICERYASSGSAWYDGLIDEVKVYNTALSAEEVLIDMNANSASSFSVLGSSEAADGIDGDATSNLVAYWDFNENTGTSTAYDKSGNGYDGTLEASMTESDWVRGKKGNGSALEFDESNDYIDTVDIDFSTGGFTLSAWFKIETSSNNSDYILSKHDGTSSGRIYLGVIGSAGNIEYALDDGSFQGASTTGYNYRDGEWHHVAMVVDSSTLKLYVNGQDSGTSDTHDNGLTTNNANWRIGRDNSSYFGGMIDEVKIFNTALTPSQVAYEYNRGLPTGHWQLDECSGAVAYDNSGNGNNGTITIGGSGSNTSAGSCSSGTGTEAWNNGTSGKFNASLDFDGSDDYVDIGNTGFTTIRSVSFWVKPDSTTQEFLQLSATDTLQVSSGTLTVGGFGTETVYIDGQQTTIFPDTNWHHVTVISSSNITANDMDIGRISTNYGAGQIDDVRIYNYALSGTQIKTIMNQGAGSFR